MKVYQEVLNKIRHFIEDNELKDGDRLPSERELSEQLNAGRSSIREALRAIELLGLIETRHGEGTFLRTYRPYHSVELLSTFVLREVETKQELLEVKFLLEKICLEKLNDGSCDVGDISDFFNEKSACNLHTQLFLHLFSKIENHLLLKIWHLVAGFTETIDQPRVDDSQYHQFYQLIKEGQFNDAANLHASIYQSSLINTS